MPVPTIEEFREKTRKSWEGKPRQKDDTTRYRFGPEFPGCFNTGMRPALMSFKRKGETVWFVGPELEVRDNFLNMFIGHKRQVGTGARKVIMRETRAAAETAFWTLCAAMLDEYRHVEQVRQQARALQAKGDPESMIAAANLLADL